MNWAQSKFFERVWGNFCSQKFPQFLPTSLHVCLIFFLLSLPVCAIPTIDTSPFEIHVDYDARIDSGLKDTPLFIAPHDSAVPSIKTKDSSLLAANTNQNIPLQMTIQNDLVPYQLAVQMSRSLSLDQNMDIQLNYNAAAGASQNQNGIVEGLFLEGSALKVTEMQQVFYQNLAPTFPMQTFLFTLNVSVSPNTRPGTYSSSLRFTMIQNTLPLFEKEVPVTVVVREWMSVEVSFVDSVSTSLDFGVVNPEVLRVDKRIEIHVLSNLGKSYQILRRRGQNMVSHLSQIEFDKESLWVDVDKENLKGTLLHDRAQKVDVVDDLFYESDVNGSSDHIALVYSLLNAARQKAGRYASSLSFVIAMEGQEAQILTFDLLLEIPKVLKFNVYPEKDLSILDFTPRVLESPVHDRLLKVETISNTGKIYRFSHSLPNGLLNNQGGKIENDKILFLRCNENGDPLLGTTAGTDGGNFISLGISNQLVFESNTAGDAAVFYIRYRIQYDSSQMSGLYRSDLHFTLSDD